MSSNIKQKPPLPKLNIKDIMPTEKSNFKCGPHLEFENGSCIPLDLLIDMVEAYNKYNEENNKKDKIALHEDLEIVEPDNYKLYLLSEFKKRFNGDQTEWINKKYLEFMEDDTKDYLENNVFRPEGPQGKFEWLSTLDINGVLSQYEEKYPDFKFLGAVPIDFDDLSYLPFKKIDFQEFVDNGVKRLGVIFNLDEHYKSGSHWVSLFTDLDKGQIYFSDSYGSAVPKRVATFMGKIKTFLEKNNHENIDMRHNKTQHQKGNSECGVYSINFILRLLKGKTFDHITKKRLTDEKVNKCRNIYFGK